MPARPDDHAEPGARRPETPGELLVQEQYGTRERARTFYDEQMRDALTARMRDFIAVQTQMIVASADPDGHPDASVRFGDPGFVSVLDDHTVCWPELRGNGVLTTLGNLAKNPRAHLMFLDESERIGLHLRGEARIVEPESMRAEHPAVADREFPGRPPERWVVLALDTSYVHCRKHFPRGSGSRRPVAWGTDDVRAKGGDYFGAKQVPAPWADGD